MTETVVLIAGSGLGGLSLAQGLRKAGIPFRVFERDHSPWDRPQGYRLHLEADAINALHEVLSADSLALFEATAMRTTANTTVLAPDLHVIKQIPTDDEHDPAVWGDIAHSGPDHRNVDRATLREIMLDGLGDQITFGKRAVSYDLGADGVSVTFADGTSASGQIRVGADGVGSDIRARRAPSLQTMDAGVQAIYGRIAWDRAAELVAPEVLQDIFAIGIDQRKVFLGLGPVQFPTEPSAAASRLGRPGRLTPREDYLVCVVGGRHAHFPVSHDELRRFEPPRIQRTAVDVLDGWPEVARSLVAAGDPASFFSVGMRTSVPTALAPDPRVTLLGDAVHAMTPTLGRGANLAIRDGALLSRQIRAIVAGETTTADGLAAYEAGMTRYGFDVVRESVQLGEQRMGQTPLPG